MKLLYPLLGAPLAAVMAVKAGDAELVSRTVEIVVQILIAVTSIFTLWRHRRTK